MKVLGTTEDNLKLVGLAVVCFLVISLYGKFRCANPTFHDPLMKKIGVGDMDGWSLSHFFFFMLLGFLFPDSLLVAMALGAAWEGFEHLAGKHRPAILGGFGDCVTTDPGVSGSWWYGRLSDLAMNLSGFVVGMALHRLVKGEKKVKG